MPIEKPSEDDELIYLGLAATRTTIGRRPRCNEEAA
jgi:hypothetical protein